MGTRDPRVDKYIANSAPFARPILTHFRDLVHAAVPDVAEDMKWSFPHFIQRGMLCSMASFKQHCAIGFWKGSLVLGGRAAGAMGHLGRITSLADLPPDRVLAGYLRKAAALNEQGVKAERKPPPPRQALEIPASLATALRKNKEARTTFEGFSYSHKKEYLEWITEARTDATRQKRLDTAIAWMAEGKTRHWKYVNR